MEYYFEMLRKSIARIQADFDFSATIDHNVSKGTFREYIVKHFLRPFFPSAYGISGGQAFDINEEISRQLDIVIYDALHSYIAPYMDDFIYFPCESVYGNIEVKSRLDKQSFEEATNNIASLKRLYRKPIETFHVNPMKELRINNVTWDIQATNEYFGIIFAYDSVSKDSVIEYISECVVDKQIERDLLPNVIVLFKEKYIITRYHRQQDGMYKIAPLKNFDGFLAINYGDDLLAEFLVLLFAMLRSIELKAMDIEELSVKLQTEALSKTEGVIPHVVL